MAKGNPQRNQMSQGLATIGNRNLQRSQEAYTFNTGLRDKVGARYDELWNENAGGGGGGGGGFNPNDEYNGRLTTIMETGGFNPDQVDALRGWGVPKDFAHTGGYSDQDKTNYRLRATAAVPGMFDGLRRGLQQRGAIGGGYGPGFDAAGIALARSQAREGAAAALNAEDTLQNNIRENKKWGASTGSDMESRIFGNQKQALDQLIQQKNAAQARGDAASARNFSERMAILSGMRGLRQEAGSELEYDEMATRGFGGGLNASQQQPGTGTMDRVMQGAAVAAPVIIAL